MSVDLVEGEVRLEKELILDLLEELSTWNKTTTIIVHAGCVFEYKGAFPKGSVAQGFYNLDSNGEGFEGHLGLKAMHDVVLHSGEHRERASYSFVFRNKEEETIFKVFLGRDSNGEVFSEQLAAFRKIARRKLID